MPGRWAFSDQPFTHKQKCHYRSYNGSDQDIMSKRRIAARTFGFMRQPVYRSACMVQPWSECPYYASEEERLNKDIDGFIRTMHDKKRARDKEILACNKAEKAYQEHKLFCTREEAWEKEMIREEFLRQKPHGRVVSNSSGVNYNIITTEYKDSYGGRKIKYLDDMCRWREALRRLYLQARSSGLPNFNIIDWRRTPPPLYPVKPTTPEPDPLKPLTRPNRVLEMQRFKPVPVPPEEIVPGDGKLAEQPEFSPVPHPPPANTVRDVIVRVGTVFNA